MHPWWSLAVAADRSGGGAPPEPDEAAFAVRDRVDPARASPREVGALVAALEALARADEALAALDVALARHPNHPELRAARAARLAEIGRLAEAEADADAALARASGRTHTRAALALADLRHRRGATDDAIATLEGVRGGGEAVAQALAQLRAARDPAALAALRAALLDAHAVALAHPVIGCGFRFPREPEPVRELAAPLVAAAQRYAAAAPTDAGVQDALVDASLELVLVGQWPEARSLAWTALLADPGSPAGDRAAATLGDGYPAFDPELDDAALALPVVAALVPRWSVLADRATMARIGRRLAQYGDEAAAVEALRRFLAGSPDPGAAEHAATLLRSLEP